MTRGQIVSHLDQGSFFSAEGRVAESVLQSPLLLSHPPNPGLWGSHHTLRKLTYLPGHPPESASGSQQPERYGPSQDLGRESRARQKAPRPHHWGREGVLTHRPQAFCLRTQSQSLWLAGASRGSLICQACLSDASRLVTSYLLGSELLGK